jgi:hypothetical protein
MAKVPTSRIYLNSKSFAKAGVVQNAMGITYSHMQDDLREAIYEVAKGALPTEPPDLLDYVEGEKADLLLNNTRYKDVPVESILPRVVAGMKLGSIMLASTKEFFDAKELIDVVRKIYQAVRSLTPVDSGTARRGIRFVKGRAGANLGTSYLRITNNVSEKDLEDELDVVGVTSPVDYGSVLEISGFTRTKVRPMTQVYRKFQRAYGRQMNITLRFFPYTDLGRQTTGRKGYKGPPRGGAYAVPVILVSRLGVAIQQSRRVRHRKANVSPSAWNFSSVRASLKRRSGR